MSDGALDFFDEIYCISLSPKNKANALRQSERLGVSDRVQFYSPANFSDFGLNELTLVEAQIFHSYRNIMEEAYKRGSANVLVFLDSVVFVNVESLRSGIEELSSNFRLSRGLHWEIILLGTDPKDNLVPITEHLFHVIRGCSLYCAGFNHTFIRSFMGAIGATKEDIIEAMSQTGVRYNSFEDWIQRYKFALNLMCIGPMAACVNPDLYYRPQLSISQQRERFDLFCKEGSLK